jgi:hypothetical protein
VGSGLRTVLFVYCLVLAACAITPDDDYADYRSRAESAVDGPLTISASVLSPHETAEVYGLPLEVLGIQPVWIEVENRDELPYWFLPQGLDPNFFPHWEAAEAFSVAGEELFDPDRRQRFEALSLPSVIPPGETTSGFVLVTPDEGFKFIHVDFLRSGRLRHVSMLVSVPGFLADYHERETFEKRLAEHADSVDYADDLEGFRQALMELPCCTTNKSGSRQGDPLNLVIVGGVEDAFAALAERGWRPTEQTWSGSVLEMVSSAVSGEPYLYAPISPLYLYGRPQDIALQKARDNIHQRNHLRLWLAPMRLRGKPVWVGQISRDIGSRMTIYSPYLTTHKIDPDVDEARTALVEDLAYSQHLTQMGLIAGVGAADRLKPRQNLTTDPYYTDGYRAVLIFDPAATPLDRIDFLPQSWKDDR